MPGCALANAAPCSDHIVLPYGESGARFNIPAADATFFVVVVVARALLC